MIYLHINLKAHIACSVSFIVKNEGYFQDVICGLSKYNNHDDLRHINFKVICQLLSFSNVMFCSCRICTDKRVARSLCNSRASCFILQHGVCHHLGFLNSQNFIGWQYLEGSVAPLCQISSKSVSRLRRYEDFLIFQDGGRPPSWICLGIFGPYAETTWGSLSLCKTWLW